MKNIKDEWDFSKERPKVLFLGNGLFYSDSNWDEFIEHNRKSEITAIEWKNIKNAPYTIRASAALAINDNERYNAYLQEIEHIHEKMNLNRQNILNLLEIPFDAILTTNYTYQIESHIQKDFHKLSNEQIKRKFAKETFTYNKQNRKDTKYLLRTYNQLQYMDNKMNIWHIHGEARRKSSIVATHDEYGKLMECVRQYIKAAGASYEKFFHSFRFKSWIDYFIMGDVYFIGSKLDYTEFDLWWLLSRRMREETHGKMYFYTPEVESIERKTIFKLLHVEVKEYPSPYDSFYAKAIEDIKKSTI